MIAVHGLDFVCLNETMEYYVVCNINGNLLGLIGLNGRIFAKTEDVTPVLAAS